ncbi:hypothetical protein [Novosphingobium sp. AP12]|uniref:hypothetical protein n=1 Tax=Novosphingobium sp. AP12 TaxID=1144305 RepID=UPI0002D7F9A7|nr:hypothetical protein [Novosphingobium sp. AP12]
MIDTYIVSGEEWFAQLPAEPFDLARHLRNLHSPEGAVIEWALPPALIEFAAIRDALPSGSP